MPNLHSLLLHVLLLAKVTLNQYGLIFNEHGLDLLI